MREQGYFLPKDELQNNKEEIKKEGDLE